MARVRIPLNRTKAANMPPACIVCGGEVDSHVARLFTWRPSSFRVGLFVSLAGLVPVVIVLLLLGSFGSGRATVGGGVCLMPVCGAPALVGLIVAFVQTRRVKLECPVCDRHRGYWTWRGFWTFAPLLVVCVTAITFAILFVVRAIDDEALPLLFLGTAAGISLWAFFVWLLQRTGPRVDRIDADDVILLGVHEVFADLLHQERHPRRKPTSNFGWDEYDPYPRRPALP
jgi:hypothetical protein